MRANAVATKAIARTCRQHANALSGTLQEYFDPQNGRFQDRVER
jgi:hypothetical protein